MAADRPMTHFRVMFSLALVMVAVLLAAGCTDFPSGNKSNITTVTDTPVTLTQTIIPETTEMSLAAPNCDIKKPVPNAILSGDPFVFHSRFSDSNKTINRVWIFGQKTAVTAAAIPDRNGLNNLTIRESSTGFLKSGIYEVIVEYPDTSSHFRLALNNREYPEWVTNQNGDLVLDLSRVRTGSMTGKDAADTIEKAITIQGSHLQIERITMNVTEPWIQIEQIGDHVIGDKISPHGTTNIPAGEILDLQVYPANYKPTEKSMAGETSSLKYAMFPVMPGVGGCNVWGESSFYDTIYMKTGPMRVTVIAETRNAAAYQIFNLTAAIPSQTQIRGTAP